MDSRICLINHVFDACHISLVDVLDELWVSGYPEKRFLNLIHTLEGTITSKLENVFPNGQGIFTTSTSSVIKLRLAEG